MFEPEDVEGECNAHLYIGDDYGDNTATMRCSLPKGHEGPHREEYESVAGGGKVTVTWEEDERDCGIELDEDEEEEEEEEEEDYE